MKQRAEILKAALKLPEDEQEKPVEEVEHLGHAGFATKEVEQAWDVEIRRRNAEIESGKAKMIPWSEVKRELFAELRTVRGR